MEASNMKALREALCDIVMLTMKVGYSIRGDVACGIIASKARHALAKPPCNCDRFTDAESARQAWLDDAGNWDEFGSPKLELHEWLFATATEQKGEPKEANNMAMREACANIAEYAKAAKCHTTDAHILGYLDQIESLAKAAFAKPPQMPYEEGGAK